MWRWSGFGASGADGALTQVAATAGEQITSIAADPLVPGRLYVATRARCAQLDGADIATTGAASLASLAGLQAPGRTEELVAVDEDGAVSVYAACWTQGVRRLATAGDALAPWSVLTPPGGSGLWCAIDAVREGATTTVLAGWWGYLPAGQGGLSDNRLGAPSSVPEQPVIDRADPSRCFAVGTQVIFRF